ncbi:MAG: DNA repair protein RecO [Oscillospiraceae bacterium]|jgi:DNA repair protein RecO (recombination protein O)|nr:DNA repair protein RecO [Oscillospiraceae bacterium]
MYIRTDAVVLRETRYKDADKLLTVLTRSHGLQTVGVRGAMSKGHIWAASTQLLAYSEMTLFAHKNRMHFKEADLVDAWHPLRSDLTRVSLCHYAAELCGAVAPEGLESGELMDLLCLMLKRACYKTQPEYLLKTAFEVALMRICGYAPYVRDCGVCGETNPRAPKLLPREGRLLCACHEQGAQALPLTEGALAALRYLLECAPTRVFSFTLEGHDLCSLSRASEAYVSAHLERGFATLDFYKKLGVSR